MTRRVLDAHPLEDVNALTRESIHEDNRVILISMPEKRKACRSDRAGDTVRYRAV